MIKRVPIWLFLILVIIFLSFSIIYGSIIVQHYDYGSRFPKVEKVIIHISKFPIEIRQKMRFGDGLGAK